MWRWKMTVKIPSCKNFFGHLFMFIPQTIMHIPIYPSDNNQVIGKWKTMKEEGNEDIDVQS